MNKLHRQMLAHLNHLVFQRIHRLVIQLRHLRQLRHLFLDHPNRKRRRINRHQRPKLRQQMPTRPDMVQMRVRKANRLHLPDIIFQILNIRHHIIHPWVIRPRKQRPHIHHNNLPLILNQGHILPNPKLPHPA